MKELLSALNEIKVKDVMTKKILSISSDSPAGDAAMIMLKNNIHGLPIVDENDKNKIVNIVTSYDLLGLIYFGRFSVDTEYIKTTKVSKLKDKKPLITVSPEANLKDVLKIMADKGIRAVPVVEDGKIAGIVSVFDIIKKIIGD